MILSLNFVDLLQVTNFQKYNLFPFDVSLSPISGGSLVIYFSKSKTTIIELKIISIDFNKSSDNS